MGTTIPITIDEGRLGGEPRVIGNIDASDIWTTGSELFEFCPTWIRCEDNRCNQLVALSIRKVREIGLAKEVAIAGAASAYTASADQTTKPPLGVKPHALWEEAVLSDRIDHLWDGIRRYRSRGKEIPQEWVDELAGHLKAIGKKS